MTEVLQQHAVGEWVRRLRTESGMSLRRLAAATAFSPSFISQVENGVVSPSIASMDKIARALGVTLGEFFAAAAGGAGGLVVRSGERKHLPSRWSQGRVEALAPMTGQRLEPLLITLEPGGRSGKHPAAHGSEHFALVLEGEASLTLGPQEHLLRAGDAVTIRAQELSRWENRAAGPLRILVVSIR